MAKMPDRCPSCQGRLIISQLDCPECGTSVSGSFEGSPVSRLSPNDLSFVLLFVRTKGNLKEMERELGISYWTIRRKLDDLADLLGRGGAGSGGSAHEDDAVSEARLAVLGRLRRVEINAEEAEALAKAIKRGDGPTKEAPGVPSKPGAFVIWKKVEPGPKTVTHAASPPKSDESSIGDESHEGRREDAEPQSPG